jgi:hypothetical protein
MLSEPGDPIGTDLDLSARTGCRRRVPLRHFLRLVADPMYLSSPAGCVEPVVASLIRGLRSDAGGRATTSALQPALAPALRPFAPTHPGSPPPAPYETVNQGTFLSRTKGDAITEVQQKSFTETRPSRDKGSASFRCGCDASPEPKGGRDATVRVLGSQTCLARAVGPDPDLPGWEAVPAPCWRSLQRRGGSSGPAPWYARRPAF